MNFSFSKHLLALLANPAAGKRPSRAQVGTVDPPSPGRPPGSSTVTAVKLATPVPVAQDYFVLSAALARTTLSIPPGTSECFQETAWLWSKLVHKDGSRNRRALACSVDWHSKQYFSSWQDHVAGQTLLAAAGKGRHLRLSCRLAPALAIRYPGGMDRPHLLFVTGKLAEPALRRTLEELGPAGRVRLQRRRAAHHRRRPGHHTLDRPPSARTRAASTASSCRACVPGDLEPVRSTVGAPRRARPGRPARPARVLQRSRRRRPEDYGGLRHRHPGRDQPRAAAEHCRSMLDAGPRLARRRGRPHRRRLRSGRDLARRRRRGAAPCATRGMRVSIDSFNPSRSRRRSRPGPSWC